MWGPSKMPVRTILSKTVVTLLQMAVSCAYWYKHFITHK